MAGYSQIKLGKNTFKKKDKTESSSSNSKSSKSDKKMSAAEMDAALKNAPNDKLWREIQSIGKSYRKDINTAYPKNYINKIKEWKTSNDHIENTASEYADYFTAFNKKNGKKCDLENAIYWAREDMKKYKTLINGFSNSASESKRYLDFGIKKAKEIEGKQSEYSATKIKNTFNGQSTLLKNIDHAKFYAVITSFNGDKTAGDALYKKAEEGEKQIEAIRLVILDEKLAEVSMPTELYRGSDKATLANGIKTHWKKKYPSDEILKVMIMESSWKKREGWEKKNGTWNWYTKSFLKGYVVVTNKVNSKQAIIYAGDIQKDHRDGDRLYYTSFLKTGHGNFVTKIMKNKVK